MDRLRTLLALTAATLMIAVVGPAGTTAAHAEDFQAQGSHLNDAGNKRNPDDEANKNNTNFQQQGSHLDDAANKRSPGDQEKAKKPK